MAVTQQTRRQAELAEVESIQAGLTAESEEIDQRRRALEADRELLQAQYRDLEAQRIEAARAGNAEDVARLRTELATVRSQLEDLASLETPLLERAQALGSHPNHQALQKARIALQREPFELRMLEVDRLLRELESAWTEAAQAAKSLDAEGRWWAEGQLRELQNGITNRHAQQSGPTVLTLPHVPDPAA